jgi:hypothetical protein
MYIMSMLINFRENNKQLYNRHSNDKYYSWRKVKSRHLIGIPGERERVQFSPQLKTEQQFSSEMYKFLSMVRI